MIDEVISNISLSKIGGAIASVVGVFCMAVIWMPTTFRAFKTYQLVIALLMYGTVGGLFLVDPAIDYFGYSRKVDYALAFGLVIGMCIVGFFNLLAAFFRKMEQDNKDLLDVMNEVKDLVGRKK